MSGLFSIVKPDVDILQNVKSPLLESDFLLNGRDFNFFIRSCPEGAEDLQPRVFET